MLGIISYHIYTESSIFHFMQQETRGSGMWKNIPNTGCRGRKDRSLSAMVTFEIHIRYPFGDVK